MKTLNIYKYLLLSVAIGLNISCDKMLDKLPGDKLYPETYFTNEQEIKLFTNKFYDLIPTAETLGKENADVIIINELLPEISGQRVVPASGGGWSFSTLRDINFYLEHAENNPNEQVREKYNSVARFFRAFFYFEKLKRFGEVPWYDIALNSNDPEIYKPRDSREFVVQKILEDLDYAIENGPAEKSLYRITKWTAMALKSRVTLFEGTFRKYHQLEGADKYLEICAAVSGEFINTSGYGIYKSGDKPYFDLFSTFSNRPEEYILARDYDESLTISHSLQQYLNSSTGGRPGLSKKVVNSYLMKDGSRFTEKPGFDKLGFYEETQDRDPRLGQTIRTPGYVAIGDSNPSAPNLAFTLTGYHIIKFTNDKKYDTMKGYNDFPIFRTAEIFLNYAEAKAELGTLTQADLDLSIQPLRDRVGMPGISLVESNNNPDPYLSSETTGYPNVTGANKGVILEIRRERTIELIMEGFRYYDIMRWKEGKLFEKPFLGMYIEGLGVYDFDKDGKNDVCFYTGSRPNVSATLFLEVGKQIELSEGDKGNILVHGLIERKWDEERDYLYPIPIQERSLTNGVITQNPGWIDGLNFN